VTGRPSGRPASGSHGGAAAGPAGRAASGSPRGAAAERAGRAASGSPGQAGAEPSARVRAAAARGAIRSVVPRPRFTPRAAILALVICAIALSLAYPVREYISQRRQIDRLLDRRDQIGVRLKSLEQQRRRLNDPVYIEKLARDRLHMCLPTQMCYEIIQPAPKGVRPVTGGQDSQPWYAKLWSSVQQANKPLSAARPGTASHGSAGRSGSAGRAGGPRQG